MNINDGFAAMVRALGKDEIDILFFEWNESSQDIEGRQALEYLDNPKHGFQFQIRHKEKIDKADFFDWLFGKEPMATHFNGEPTFDVPEWYDLVRRARQCFIDTD